MFKMSTSLEYACLQFWTALATATGFIGVIFMGHPVYLHSVCSKIYLQNAYAYIAINRIKINTCVKLFPLWKLRLHVMYRIVRQPNICIIDQIIIIVHVMHSWPCFCRQWALEFFIILYCTGWTKKVSHYQVSLLNRIKNVIKATFFINFDYKMSKKCNKFVLNIPCVIL